MPDNDSFVPPWFGFRFRVDFSENGITGLGGDAGGGDKPVCSGLFSEVTGLDASMEAKLIREGGANYGAHQRAGAVSFGTVICKRGMTAARDLWTWWSGFAGAAPGQLGGALAYRMTVRITLLSPASSPSAPETLLRWRLDRAMPVKFKAADFSAKASDVAVEELHLVHEGLYLD